MFSEWTGEIEKCLTYLPNCNCCDFSRHYIVLYPGEYENSHLDKKHMEVTDEDYFGGKKGRCSRLCKEGELKPMDCKSYPYFPKINKNGNLRLLRCGKCPISESELTNHRKEVIRHWNVLVKDVKIREWVEKIKLQGYSYALENSAEGEI